MNDEVIALLKIQEYFREITDEALNDVASISTLSQYPAGAVVYREQDPLGTIGFLVQGRLKAVRIDSYGNESPFRMIERGEQFGMMVGALSEPVPIRVVTLEPSKVLILDHEMAMDLVMKHADMRRHWMRTYARSIRHQALGQSPSRSTSILALFHQSPETRDVALKLIERLQGLGEEIAVFSDTDGWKSRPGLRFRSLSDGGRDLELAEIREQATAWNDANRIVFDVSVDTEPDKVRRLLEFADRALFFIRSRDSESAFRKLRSHEAPTRGLRDKISVVWLLEGGAPVAPAVPNLRDHVCRDFKIAEREPPFPDGRAFANGMERLVHFLRGVRIGVALGGGGARGMSHLGVLKALEQNGIVVDMIAGTSAGAMTGVLHASGMECDYTANRFSTDLKPSRLFRLLPEGNYWYLAYKFRSGQFDPMLRKYLHDWRLEQLAIPSLSVTADLVSGESVVRDQGDAVHAVLESINLPVLSAPIIRSGRALIDGGLVNNIPANVLVTMGCNFVIAVSVTAKMEKEFCDITPESPTPSRAFTPILKTLLRSFLVQSTSLNAFGVQPADVVIEPDVSRVDLAEFMRAKELAAIGEAAALDQIPKIQGLLHRLDPQLFQWSTDS